VHVSVADLRRLRAPSGSTGPEAASQQQILSRVSLKVEPGQRLTLLGESGGGKTTLLKLCDRLVEAGEGSVRVLGKAVSEWEIAELRRRVVFVPHAPAFFGGDLRQELNVARRWRGEAPADDGRLREALARVRLSEVPLESDPTQLSGGEQTRACLARALLVEPELLLLDEPTSALDVRLARELLADLVAWAADRGSTLVVTTHRPQDALILDAPAFVLLGGHLHGPFPGAALAAGDVDEPSVTAFLGTL
jgi:putative ABC transport system ATP-binding protein